MQRGQGRGRGRNPTPSRSTSSVGTRGTRSARSTRSTRLAASTRSSSRNSISRTQHNRGPTSVRRSARLAQLVNAELNGLVNGHSDPATAGNSMADVARPRALGNRSVRSRHHSGNSRTPGRSRSGRPSLSPEEIRYAMDIIVQPPPSARVGHTLNGAIIVRLRTTNADPDDAIADSSNLVAVATVIPGPNSNVSTDPVVLNSLLAGRRVDSIHPFSDDEADGNIASMDMDDPRGVGYMRFSELIIRQPGTYRIRITLIRIRNSSSDPPAASATGGVSVQIVDSNPIVVQANGQSSNLAAYNGDESEDDGGWLDVLRTLQERRMSR